MTSHSFLSDAWIQAAEEIRVEFAGRVGPPSEAARVNVVVTDVPFGSGEVAGHIDTTDGSSVPALGHLDNPDATIILTYRTARQALVDLRFEELIRAFMTGEIEVTGDVTMIMNLQELDPTAEEQALADEISARLQAITE